MLRFRHVGGHVVNEARQVIPLAHVEALIREYHRRAHTLSLMGERYLAKEWALLAWTLHLASEGAKDWRRAAGWTDPYDYDRRRAS